LKNGVRPPLEALASVLGGTLSMQIAA